MIQFDIRAHDLHPDNEGQFQIIYHIEYNGEKHDYMRESAGRNNDILTMIDYAVMQCGHIARKEGIRAPKAVITATLTFF